jgi:hypothetical protein
MKKAYETYGTSLSKDLFPLWKLAKVQKRGKASNIYFMK